MASPKELKLNERLGGRLSGKALEAFRLLSSDPEVEALQEAANIVSIKRLGYNDHGPVHMRKVTSNALKMAQIFQEKSIALSLEKEGTGTWEDSVTALTIAAFLHDIGMSVARSHHEMTGIWLALPLVDKVLQQIYPQQLMQRVSVRSLIIECILGHMGTIPIHSVEAGILLVADGCDMEKGRARIPLLLGPGGKIGDLHKYSSNAVEKVKISAGDQRPLKIEVQMSEAVGYHQVEEVLFPKIKASPIRDLVEVHARLGDEEAKVYR